MAMRYVQELYVFNTRYENSVACSSRTKPHGKARRDETKFPQMLSATTSQTGQGTPKAIKYRSTSVAFSLSRCQSIERIEQILLISVLSCVGQPVLFYETIGGW